MAPRKLLTAATAITVLVLIGLNEYKAYAKEQKLTPVAVSDDLPMTASISKLTETEAEARTLIEEQILASTVQLFIQNWIFDSDGGGTVTGQSMSHATVMKDGRLVTHNHFNHPLEVEQADEGMESYGIVKIFDSRGRKLFQTRLSAFDVIWSDQDTTIFAYEEETWFESFGLRSAEFNEWASLPLQAGMEVAQVDWDGKTTRVDWTTVQEVLLDDGIRSLVLEDGVKAGASGGGIFWEGVHIANNSRSRLAIDAAGNIIDSMTTVTLNPAQVASLMKVSSQNQQMSYAITS